jgi:hypothetical protein
MSVANSLSSSTQVRLRTLSPLRQFSLRFYPDTFRFGFYPLSFLHDLNISGSTILWQWQTRTGTGYPPTYSTRMAA